MSAPVETVRRPTRRTVVLLGIALGLLALLTTTATWVQATASSALSAVVPVAAVGTEAAPAAAAGALVAVAAALALTLAGPVGSRVVGVVLLLAGAVVTSSAVSVLVDPEPAASSAAAADLGVGLLDGPAAATGWPLVNAAAGALVVLLGLVTILRAGRWRTDVRHEVRGPAVPAAEGAGDAVRPARTGATGTVPGATGSVPGPTVTMPSRAADPGSDQAAWDALSRGEDPTDPGGTRAAT